MPGRLPKRTSVVSNLPSKSSSQSMAPSRRATASPTTDILDEGPTSKLRSRISAIFSEAQKSTASHRKLVVSMKKIQEECVYDPPVKSMNVDSREQFIEDDFNFEFTRCMIRLMGVKKTETVGDRLVRFISLYLSHANEKDTAIVSKHELVDVDCFPETANSRLVTRILSLLLRFMASKEKTVRYRATQMVSQIINALDSIEDQYYYLLRNGLLKRIRDKEPRIRVHAVVGLGRLAGNEEGEEQEDCGNDDDAANGLLETLFDILQNDTSPDVRRSLLLNLPLTPKTLPYLLERARDLDPATRRALYLHLLPALGDFRHLSLSMREKLLRWGLRDRDELVRRAAARLFRERWIEDCVASHQPTEDGKTSGRTMPKVDGLLELLERVDVINSGNEGGIAGEAMSEFWTGRPDYRDELSFVDAFWADLTPESVYMARTLNDFYHKKDNRESEAIGEEKMPEVTRFVFFLEKYINDLVKRLRDKTALRRGAEEDDSIEQEFIAEQLLHIAKTLDYSDEAGRRNMFSLLRETLAIAELPDEITRLVIEVLRDVCGNDVSAERDFCSVVLEAIAEVHDTIVIDNPLADHEDESFHSARSELSDTAPKESDQLQKSGIDWDEEQSESRVVREIMVNMKCLHIAQCMLQNVEGHLQSNVHLVTMLNNLVVPAVRSHDAPIRERGLLCLGLCCLLDRNLADENLTLFLHCFSKGHDTLQISAIHIITDILETHPMLVKNETVNPDLQKMLWKVFSKGMKAHLTPDVQATVIVALCKLMLISVVEDDDLLKQIAVCFFDPATRDNAVVRQALSYFLPVYCHGSRRHMERMAKIAGAIIHTAVDLKEELNEDEEMVGIGVVGNMLVDWTDARKLVVQDEADIAWNEAGQTETKAVNGDIHLVLAESLLDRALTHGCAKEDRKAIISMLGKLFITSHSTFQKLQFTNELVAEAIENNIAPDASSRTSLSKLQAAINKALSETGKSMKDATGVIASTAAVDNLAALEELDESVTPKGKDVKREFTEMEASTEGRDSLLEELLNDEDDDIK